MIRTPEEQHLHELIESYVAPLRSEIKALRKELAEQQVKNLNIPDVVKSFICDAQEKGGSRCETQCLGCDGFQRNE